MKLIVGSVSYDPKVVTIWEGIRDYFRGAPVECDYVLFSNYESQVQALLDGRIDIAWNTNLAYLRVREATAGACRVLAMRDADVEFRTLLVATPGTLNTPADLKGKTLALGSADSVQAAVMPVWYLAREGLTAGTDYTLLRFNSDVGKHGDTGRSEIEAVHAVLDGKADAAAVGDATWVVLTRSGEVAPGAAAPFWTSPAYCHCNFTAMPTLGDAAAQAWTEHLLKMDWADPEHRRILELEGLRRWVRPQLDGYEPVAAALRDEGVL